MKVLIACEFSGIVRDAFIARGHEAVSIDLLPTERPGPHIIADLTKFNPVFFEQFDLAICHPPCTHLAVSGAAWFKRKLEADPDIQSRALYFVWFCMFLPVNHICVENPVSIISSHIRKPDQIIQPFQFGHTEMKKTCLWLTNLPRLEPTYNVYNEMMQLPKAEREKNHYMSPGANRGFDRSRTFQGIADAMAEQWGKLE